MRTEVYTALPLFPTLNIYSLCNVLKPAVFVLQLYSINTVCPRISDPFHIVTHFIKWVTSSWTDSAFVLMVRTYSSSYGTYIHLRGVMASKGLATKDQC